MSLLGVLLGLGQRRPEFDDRLSFSAALGLMKGNIGSNTHTYKRDGLKTFGDSELRKRYLKDDTIGAY